MKYIIQTLGCAMNYSDTERIETMLEKMGYTKTDKEEEADLYIFNTCSIRQKGEDRVYGKLQTLGRYKKRNPRLLVGLTGCMVRKTSTKNSPKEEKDKLFNVAKNVDFIFNIKDLAKLEEVLQEASPNLEIKPVEVGDKEIKDYLKIPAKYTLNYKAYVPIQIGCDKFCTYCIVPYSRGREQSRPMADIIKECEALVEKGYKEITLGGQTVNSYGKSAIDKKSGLFNGIKDPFITLLKELNKLHKKGLNRLKFTSPHPYDYSDELIQAHKDLEVLTKSFHIPIQSGDNETLKKMNRRYTVEDYKKIIEKIRKIIPDASIATDIIVGFCGETKEQFENTYKTYKDIKWDMAYIARYSERPGTVATRFFKDDVPREEKARRWHKLNKLLEECSYNYNKSLQGKQLEVLVDYYNEKTGELEGKSRENKTVQFKPKNTSVSPYTYIGKIINVKATTPLQWVIKAEEV